MRILLKTPVKSVVEQPDVKFKRINARYFDRDCSRMPMVDEDVLVRSAGDRNDRGGNEKQRGAKTIKPFIAKLLGQRLPLSPIVRKVGSGSV